MRGTNAWVPWVQVGVCLTEGIESDLNASGEGFFTLTGAYGAGSQGAIRPEGRKGDDARFQNAGAGL
ncbi:hypothetical protein BH11ARM2_BH11ARM2_32340 [soil metagenome]